MESPVMTCTIPTGGCKHIVIELQRVFNHPQAQEADAIATVRISHPHKHGKASSHVMMHPKVVPDAPKASAAATASTRPAGRRLRLAEFDFGRMIGAGSFGRVFAAKHKTQGSTVAVKSMSKAAILKGGQLKHVRDERDMLLLVDHPFTIHLHGTMQDKQSVFLAMEYVPGGEFFTHLRDHGRLQENDARFYAAQLVLAIEYLHNKNVAYRDLKPENLLLASDGYIKVTDFGFAKVVKHRTATMCGTPDYLAPEIVMNQPHTKAVDWWSLGCVIYEMLFGVPPFYTGDPVKTYARILHGSIKFPASAPFSQAVMDLIRRFLTADASKRLGSGPFGSREIRDHSWFRGVDWDLVAAKCYSPSYVPPVKSADDTSNFDDYSTTPPMHHAWELSNEEQQLFADF